MFAVGRNEVVGLYLGTYKVTEVCSKFIRYALGNFEFAEVLSFA
jgi:hypothetical protein